MRFEGQVNTPESAVTSGVTCYAVTGNITTATLLDANPTPAESEILYSRDGPSGWEIVGTNPDGTGFRSVVANMPQAAYGLAVDPSGKYVYYTRNGNLQRTEIRDGTSNTILAGETSFGFNASGSKIAYRKAGTDQLWTANSNGSGAILLNSYPGGTPEVLGCIDDQYMMVRDTLGNQQFYAVDLTTGVASTAVDYSSAGPVFLVGYSAFERCLYVYFLNTQASKFQMHRLILPHGTHGVEQHLTYNDANPLTIGITASGGPAPQMLAAFDNHRFKTLDAYGANVREWPIDNHVYGTAWPAARSSLPMAGIGTPFLSGAGAILISEMSTRTPAVIVADAVTRTSMVTTSLNDSGNGNPLYRIDCDNLSKLSSASANGYAWKHWVSGATGLKGAIVSFDGATGTIANIVTFNRKPTVSQQGGEWTIEGDLVSIYDGKTGKARPVSARVTLR